MIIPQPPNPAMLPQESVLTLIAPTAQEIGQIATAYGIAERYLSGDFDKAATVIFQDGLDLTYCRFQIPLGDDGADQRLKTIALISTPQIILLVAAQKIPFLSHIAKGLHFGMTLQEILIHIIDAYLDEVQRFENRIDDLIANFDRNTGEQDLTNAFALSRNMAYLASGLDSLARIIEDGETFAYFPKDLALYKAKSKLAHVEKSLTLYIDVLAQAIDLVEGLLNNKLNDIIKFLTIITIAVNVPMIIAGFWGMNVGLPLANMPNAFWALLSASGIFTILTIFLLKR